MELIPITGQLPSLHSVHLPALKFSHEEQGFDENWQSVFRTDSMKYQIALSWAHDTLSKASAKSLNLLVIIPICFSFVFI